jgi:hypothetical protein
MRKVLGRLFGERESAPAALPSRLMHLPEDFRSPARMAVYSGPAEEDSWPALYLARMIERTYGETDLSIICRSTDGWLFDMLHWKPRILPYEARPSLDALAPGSAFDEGTILFHPYLSMDPAAAALMASSGAGIRVSPAVEGHPCLSIQIRTGTTLYPTVIHRMCAALGMETDATWKPLIPRQIQDRVSALMAPVSGRALPYIAATSRAVAILEKSRAEIPLRTITIAGKNVDMAGQDRETRVAVIAGASAVITDSPGLWADARAMGVPAAGLDPSGTFMPWTGDTPSRTEKEFVEAWEQLLRRGW